MGVWLKSLRTCWPHGRKKVQRACALCNAALDDTVVVETPAGGLPRYDLCSHCEHHLFAQWGISFQDYMDGLDVPVVVTDGDFVLKAGNRAACALLGKDMAQMGGMPGGTVFECEHALQPHECGRTVHCSGCVIRNTVTNSYLTGTPHMRVPATLDRGTSEGRVTERLLISTLLRDNVVLLKLERDSADPAQAAQ